MVIASRARSRWTLPLLIVSTLLSGCVAQRLPVVPDAVADESKTPPAVKLIVVRPPRSAADTTAVACCPGRMRSPVETPVILMVGGTECLPPLRPPSKPETPPQQPDREPPTTIAPSRATGIEKLAFQKRYAKFADLAAAS